MPATSRLTTFAAPINRNTIADNLKNAWNLAGMNLVEDYAATATSDRILIYNLFNNSATYGTIFLENRITNTRFISSRLSTSWNSSSKTLGAIATTATPAVQFTAIGQVRIYSVNHAEARLLYIEQGTSIIQVCGVMRPNIKPGWWNENTFPYFFHPSITFTAFFPFLPAANNPYNTTANYSSLYIAALNAKSPIIVQPDVMAGNAVILPATNNGVSGIFSNELALCAGAGLKRGDMLGNYLLLNGAISGLAIASNEPN